MLTLWAWFEAKDEQKVQERRRKGSRKEAPRQKRSIGEYKEDVTTRVISRTTSWLELVIPSWLKVVRRRWWSRDHHCRC
jgi:hypothetical protein